MAANQRSLLTSLFVSLMGAACIAFVYRESTLVYPAPARPNMLIILADDLGYSDLGCYGSEIHTPNLDRLARNGLRLTQCYNTARCCPTRASLLTGLYPHQTGVGGMTFEKQQPGYRGQLMPNTVTVAEVLKEAGYSTAMVGKWHVSLTNDNAPDHLKNLNNQKIAPTFSDPKTYPTSRGFDQFYGIIWGVCNYFDPFTLVSGTKAVRSVPPNYYITDALTDSALVFLDRQMAQKKPFLLYAAYTAPHWPLHARPEDVANYTDVYKIGWEAIRTKRYECMVKLGLIDPHTTPLSPRFEGQRTWEANPTKAFDAALMATHAAMIDRMDQNIGRLLKKLEDQRQLDNTLIVFLSDNGASYEFIGNGGFDRPTQTRAGKRVVYGPEMKQKSILPGPDTTSAAIGPAWANVANTPFRLWKRYTHEGGISTPLIIHYPNGMRIKPGSLSAQPAHVIDLMPTLVALAGATYPTNRKGNAITPMQGVSLLPALSGKPLKRNKPLFWEHEGSRAIRDGQWKLVAPGAEGAWELYDLSKDRTELTNLARTHPQKVIALRTKWETWAYQTNVLPWIWTPAYPVKSR